MKFTSLWSIAQCSLVEVTRRFRGAYCLHHWGNDGGRTPLNRRYTSTTLHSATSQISVIFIATYFNVPNREWKITKTVAKNKEYPSQDSNQAAFSGLRMKLVFRSVINYGVRGGMERKYMCGSCILAA
jgi:hypothetical protein